MNSQPFVGSNFLEVTNTLVLQGTRFLCGQMCFGVHAVPVVPQLLVGHSFPMGLKSILGFPAPHTRRSKQYLWLPKPSQYRYPSLGPKSILGSPAQCGTQTHFGVLAVPVAPQPLVGHSSSVGPAAVWGDVGRSGRMQGSLEGCGAVRGDAKWCGEMWGGLERCGAI